jgi:hypothetical protein
MKKENIRSSKEVIGHSREVVESYHKRANCDYAKLSYSDKKLINQIDLCLKNLSENGREYWAAYYG